MSRRGWARRGHRQSQGPSTLTWASSHRRCSYRHSADRSVSFLSRADIGEGGHIDRALSFLSTQTAKSGWSIEPRKRVSDAFGAFAWTVDLKSPADQEYRSILTARRREPPFFWSVTEDLEDIATRWDAWLFGYYATPLELVRAYDPFRYDHVEDTSRGKTYEFPVRAGVDLSSWLVNPSYRTLHKKLD